MNKKLFNALIFIFTLTFSVLFIVWGNIICSPPSSDDDIADNSVYARAVVKSIDDVTQTTYDIYTDTNVLFTAQVLSGEYKGKEFAMIQNISDLVVPVPEQVKIGDKIIAVFSPETEFTVEQWSFGGYDRINNSIILIAIFLLLIIIIGRKKGVTTIISLAITIATIFLVYIPSILNGYNIYISTAIIAIFIIFTNLVLLNNLNKKTTCAILGNIGGIIIAGVIAYIATLVFKVTGFVDQDYTFLSMLNPQNPIDLKAVVWGGVVIGALGAVMDVAMSISSAMQELSDVMENKTFAKMFKSGMNIGKDAIGTMTNTLILAYVGSSLALILLFLAYDKDILVLFNLEMILVELIQAISGSMGILFAVPTTVLISALVFNKKKKSD